MSPPVFYFVSTWTLSGDTIRLAQQGDEKALGVLVYAVSRLVWYFLSGEFPGDAEALAREALGKILLAKRFKPRGATETEQAKTTTRFVVLIVQRTVIDFLRKFGGADTVPIDDEDGTGVFAEESEEVEAFLDEREALAISLALVEVLRRKLLTHERIALYRHARLGETEQEIGESFGKVGRAARDSAHSWLNHARKKLHIVLIHPVVSVIEGPDTGGTLTLLEERRPYVIGRGQHCDLKLRDASISLEHVRLTREGMTVLASDPSVLDTKEAESRQNRIILGDKALRAGGTVPWSPSLALRAGATVLALERASLCSNAMIRKILAQLEN